MLGYYDMVLNLDRVLCCCVCVCVLLQAEDGIRDLVRSRGLGDVYKRQVFFKRQGTIFFRNQGKSFINNPF